MSAIGPFPDIEEQRYVCGQGLDLNSKRTPVLTLLP